MSGPDVAPRHGQVVAVRENLLSIESNTALIKNEIAFVHSGGRRLMAEVLRVHGRGADLQVYEDIRGMTAGCAVELTGRPLSATLGPGLLGQVYDGLQNPLPELALDGPFLAGGDYRRPLDPARQWRFIAHAQPGQTVEPGQSVGQVQEGLLAHHIVVPLDWRGRFTVTAIGDCEASVTTPVARLTDARGRECAVTLQQTWPVREPLAQRLLAAGRIERLLPTEPLITGIRCIDTLFPIALGGSACIPGPFGAGKTVLQNLIARHAAVDVVVLVACGERAGEVVETLSTLAELEDPRTGGSLMARTVVVCNTSAMPVAARESSLYLGLTIGEYYRHLGYRVLMLADSTSRWAQALREVSGRMEEIPGDEAYPAYLESTVRAAYARAGLTRHDQRVGSLTLIGTVSPAGGNLDEPVTQATLGVVKCFLGLSAARAYQRAYPAIDPLLSWSRYHGQLADWYDQQLGPDWRNGVEQLASLLKAGDAIAQMVQVVGEEGIALADFVRWQAARLVDQCYLQQDAFDAVDAASPLTRQRLLLKLHGELLSLDYAFEDRDAAQTFFTHMAGRLRNLNYTPLTDPGFDQLLTEIRAFAASATRAPPSARNAAANVDKATAALSGPTG